MDESSIVEEREALKRRRCEIERQLQALTRQEISVGRTSQDMRRDTLVGEICGIDRRLAEIDLDEQSLRRMEGGE